MAPAQQTETRHHIPNKHRYNKHWCETGTYATYTKHTHTWLKMTPKKSIALG